MAAAIPCYLTARLLTAGLGLGVEAALVAVVVAVLVGAAVFFGLARRMKIAELDLVLGTLRARLPLG